MGLQADNKRTILSKIRNLVFDLDGTLVDSIPGIGASLGGAFLSIGREMPLADLRAAIGPPIGIIAKRLEPDLSDDEMARIERHYRSSYDTDGWRNTPLFPDVAETLQSCKQQGYRLFIVTNKPRIPTEKIVQHLGLESLFEEIVTRDSQSPGYASKAEMLGALLQRQALSTESTVMIGDTAEDGEAAELNHLKFVYVTYGYGAVSSPELSVDSLAALQSLLAADQITQEKASA
jgi:phosphoglycolate phosphatase